VKIYSQHSWNDMLTSCRRRGRYIGNLRPALFVLASATTVLHRCDNSANYDVGYSHNLSHAYTHTHTQFDFTI
jgi:hypothetical protein